MGKDKSTLGTLRFWLRTDRPNKDGSAPIHLVYQLRGNKRCYSIPKAIIFPINWNAELQQAIYLDKEAAKKLVPEIKYDSLLNAHAVEKINGKLQQIKADIKKVEERFTSYDRQYDCITIINELKKIRQPQTKKEDPETNIADFIERFSKETTAHKPGTIKSYTGLMNQIRRFEKEKKQLFTFEKIDVPLIKSFQNFLLEKRESITKNGKSKIVQINNITVAKQLSTLKTLLRRAEDEYDIVVNPKFKKFKNPHPRKDNDLEVIALTDEEFYSIYNLDLSKNKRLDEVRDIYCFSVATGFRYGDLEQFSRSHIKKDNTIRMASSDKNGKMIKMPLTPISYAIIQKYADRYKPLPVTAKGKIISNQKLNDYIKEIGQLAGIDTPVEVAREYGTKKKIETYKKYELLSIHTGRKTFTTLSLEKGIPLQDVMSLTTHSSFKAVKRYINVTEERQKAVMANAWGELPNPLKAVK